MLLALSALSAAAAPPATDAAQHPAELVALAKEFRAWRSPASGAIPDYVKEVEQQKQGLTTFRRRLEAINPQSWPVHAKIDYLVLQIEMDSLDFALRVTREVSRNPDFYTSEAVENVTHHVGGRYQMGPGVPVPYDEKRAASIVAALNDTPAIVGQGPKALTEAVPELGGFASRRLEGVQKNYAEFARVVGQHLPEPYKSQIGPAAEKAAAALVTYKAWIDANQSKMKAPFAIGRPAFEWLTKRVAGYPYNTDQILVQAETERARNWAFLQFERQKNRRLPSQGSVLKAPLPPVATNKAYSELKDATDVLTRLWADEYELVTRPDYLGPFRHADVDGVYIEPFGLLGFPTKATAPGTKTEFVVAPDHWFAKVYQEFAKRFDPGVNHPHSDYLGHSFEGAVSKKTTCDFRRPHNTRGDSWVTYMEEVQLQLNYPFVAGPRTREWIYGLSLWRVERLVLAVKLADGTMTPEDSIKYLVQTVPWMDEWKAGDLEAYDPLVRPTFQLTYQLGKFEIYKLMADRMKQLGDKFDLREFHDTLLATGQIPVSLARWELTGDDSEIKYLWERAPVPVR
jgi:hypothetical protein